ncbi:MAD2 mitotic arrest deficient-like 2, partial [Dissophora globulifera]
MILYIRGIYPPVLFESTQKYNCPIKTARHPGLVSYIQQIVLAIRSELFKDSIERICLVTLDPTGKALDRFVFEMSTFRAFDDRFANRLGGGDHPATANHSPPRGNSVLQDRSLEKTRRLDKGKGRAHDHYGTGAHQGYDGRENDQEFHLFDEEKDYEKAGEWQSLHPLRDDFNMAKAESRKRDERRFGSKMALTTDVETLFRAMLLKISVCDSYLKPLTQDCSFTVVVETTTPGNGPDSKADFPWTPINAASSVERSKLSASLTETNAASHRRIIPVKTIDIAGIQ